MEIKYNIAFFLTCVIIGISMLALLTAMVYYLFNESIETVNISLHNKYCL